MENDRKRRIRELNPVLAPTFYHIWKVVERWRRRQRMIEVRNWVKESYGARMPCPYADNAISLWIRRRRFRCFLHTILLSSAFLWYQQRLSTIRSRRDNHLFPYKGARIPCPYTGNTISLQIRRCCFRCFFHTTLVVISFPLVPTASLYSSFLSR